VGIKLFYVFQILSLQGELKMSKRYYIVDNREIALTLLPNAKLVVPAKEYHPGNIAARLAHSNRLALVTDVSRRYLVFIGDPLKFEEVRTYGYIHATRSAYRDPNGLEFFLTDHINVQFKDDVGEKHIRQLGMKYEFLPKSRFQRLWRLAVLDPADEAPLELANQLSKLDEVVFAEPDALQKAKFEHENLLSDIRQWHLKNDGQKEGIKGADVGAFKAWKVSLGSSRVRVVVHDSGVDIDHDDLKKNMLPGWDFDNDDINAIHPSNSHGTLCAGIIAAKMNRNGVVGVAPDCRIVPLRAAGSHTWSVWAKMFRWAAQHGEIISCSWTLSFNNTLSIAIRDVQKKSRLERGIPVFCATGNWGIPRDKVGYPASIENTIAVGASTNRDLLADFSNYGKGIDIVAPGMDITTTDIMGYGSGSDSYTTFSGTSAATSLAAGIGALLLSVNPLLSAAQVRLILRESADKIDRDKVDYDERGWSKKYGFGRINADRAVQMAQSCRPVALRSTNEKYICAENGGGGELVADRSEIVTWETFQMLPVGENKAALIAHNGQYIRVSDNSECKVGANGDFKSVRNIFSLERLSKHEIVFKVKNDRYLCVEDNNPCKIVTDRNPKSSLEVFTLIQLDTGRRIALKTSNGQYVGVKDDRKRELVVDCHHRGKWETFDLVDLNNGKVALRGYDGHYLCAEEGGGREIIADRIMIAGWQSFKIKDLGDGKVAFRAANDQYLCAEEGERRKLMANSDELNSWETFSLIEV
jgi:subtilisin family serine protease